MATSFTSFQTDKFSGTLHMPGDKSISHRALIIGALAVGETVIEHLLESEDILRTITAIQALGITVTRDKSKSTGYWRLQGRGIGGLSEPADILNMGNSGTSTRLLLGAFATHQFTSILTGDASLRQRPMQQVIEPLCRIGAHFLVKADNRLPLAITGTASPVPIIYRAPIASAQVKSAILLAGLNTPGTTVVVEPLATRDHTELLLRDFGATITVEQGKMEERIITLTGQPELSGRLVRIPSDPSSAAFPTVATLLIPGAKIELTGVCVNPLRYGLYLTLREMGAHIEETNTRLEGSELVADLVIHSSALTGIEVPFTRVPSMIDEYPILAIAAACARGTTCMHGIGELKFKESNRLIAVAEGLTVCGCQVEVDGNTLIIHGTGSPPVGGGKIDAEFDHRIAMAFLILGMVTRQPITVVGTESIATSFPDFISLMNTAGAHMRKISSTSH